MPKIHIWKSAQLLALPLAAAWMVAFLCWTYMLSMPLLSFIYWAVGVYALVSISRKLSLFRFFTGNRSLLRTFWMGLATMLCCALLTTFVQFLYLQFVDAERFIGIFTMAADDPQLKATWEQLYPGESLADVIRSMSINEVIRYIFIFNLFLALFYAFAATLLSLIWRVKVKV